MPLAGKVGMSGISIGLNETVRETALSCCQQKRYQRRFDGTGKHDPTQVPTFDMILMKETATSYLARLRIAKVSLL